MKPDTKTVAVSAIIGALYAALTMLLSPISYGPLQLRISELLCILPYFLPFSAVGLFFGCIIANIVSAAGILDIVFGSLATLCAALCTALAGKHGRSRKTELIACAMPVLWNSVIVGAVMTLALAGVSPLEKPSVFALYAAQIGVGEAAVMFAGGLPLMRFLPRQSFFRKLTDEEYGKS